MGRQLKIFKLSSMVSAHYNFNQCKMNFITCLAQAVQTHGRQTPIDEGFICRNYD